MQFNGKLEIKATDVIKKRRGLQDFGPVQKFIDSESMKRMYKYEPFGSGGLANSTTLFTKVGSGQINQYTPGARYLYYGKLMVSSITGSAWARKGEKKILTEIDLNYSKAEHPLAGPFWFKRMAADNKDDILKGAQEIANRKSK